MNNINAILEKLTLEEKVGQLLCFNIIPEMSDEEFDDLLRRTKAGGVYVVVPHTPERLKQYREVMQEASGIPGIVSADIEWGPDSIEGEKITVFAMGTGACDDAELVEKMHRASAEVNRKAGIHLSFSPVVDINRNPDNPITNIRAVSDSADQVIKMASAQVRGFQKDGLIMTTCKHFPGDGIDDRNQHFCTTINSLSAKEWMDTFGKAYKAMFKEGAAAVMIGHISLPALQDPEEYDEGIGYRPATLSYSLQTKLLREKLGFKGCIISDALSMIGCGCAMPAEKIAVEFIKAGGDFLIYPLPDDHERIIEAVKNGEISMERLNDAVRHVLELKEKARLFEDEEKVLADMDGKNELYTLAERVAEKSITVVRNQQDVLPVKLEKGARILLVNIMPEKSMLDFNVLEEELKKRGFEVDSLTNPRHYIIKETMDTYDCILVNCNIHCRTYPGGGLRVNWTHIWPFWRGYLLQHPKMVFTAFGDPYKLHDFPYVRTYVNAYGHSESIQRGFVKVLLGETEATGKNPVSHQGYFEREV